RFIPFSWEFTHPPVNVWQAWTDSSIVKLWFGSDPNGEVLDAKLDVQVNGSFSVAFANSDGTEFTAQGMYKEVNEPNRLVFTWGWANQPEVHELISLEFSPDGAGTLMTFEQSKVDPSTSMHNYEEGWRSTFQKLERALGTINP
ncbi:MAG TPA: SRPBCC domain-containing protein, partial [Anaerolineales bacterium]|nr:SRPBCC domain-containing protein [Anaerolineales bacterium]